MKYNKMKFNTEVTNSYNSIQPVYQYRTEQFSNNINTYHEGTKWSGIFLAFVSGIFFTISAALVKGMKNIDPMILLSIQAIVQILVMLFIACIDANNLFGPKGHTFLIQIQGIVGGMTLSLLYYSYRRLPLFDVTTITFSSPVIVIILSFLFLKEPCGVLCVTVICALSAGVILVARPPFLFEMHRDTTYDVTGHICALLATFFTALKIVIMRKCSEIHHSVLVFNLSIWSLIFALILLAFVPIGHPIHFKKKFILPSDWFTWEMIAITGLLAQVLEAKALKIEGAAKISVTRSLDIILAYIIQIYFFEEIPSITSIIGALLIVISAACMGFEREIYGVCDFIP